MAQFREMTASVHLGAKGRVLVSFYTVPTDIFEAISITAQKDSETQRSKTIRIGDFEVMFIHDTRDG